MVVLYQTGIDVAAKYRRRSGELDRQVDDGVVHNFEVRIPLCRVRLAAVSEVPEHQSPGPVRTIIAGTLGRMQPRCQQ